MVVPLSSKQMYVGSIPIRSSREVAMVQEYYHPYVGGYDTLPKLKKLTTPIFLHKITDELLAVKKASCESQIVFAEHEMTDEIYKVICDFILTQIPDLEPPYTFQNLGMQICEELIISRVEDDRDWTAAAFACFPAGWYPEQVVGQTFVETHHEIPMRLDNASKLMKACVNSGPYERFIWGLAFDTIINRHPRITRCEYDPQNPIIYVRVERQILYGFPEHKCFLFVLQHNFIPENEIKKEELIKALEGMSDKELDYKGYNKEMIASIKSHWGL